jgi:hypothetical protein
MGRNESAARHNPQERGASPCLERKFKIMVSGPCHTFWVQEIPKGGKRPVGPRVGFTHDPNRCPVDIWRSLLDARDADYYRRGIWTKKEKRNG